MARRGRRSRVSVDVRTVRTLKVLDVLPQDRQEDNEGGTDVTISYSDDAEAAWLRKGNRAYYGYKIHAAIDSRDG